MTLGWFGVLKNQIAAQQFLLFILIWSISIILAIFSKFPDLVTFPFKQFCFNVILFYIKFLDIFYIIILIFIFSIILILMLRIQYAG